MNSEDNLTPHLDITSFDYSKLENDISDYLQDKETKMRLCMGNAYTELGKHLSDARDKLADHHEGVFEKWYTALGFKRDRVYNLINRYNYVLRNSEDIPAFEELPLSLSYEVARPSINPELKKAVLDGDITTHKEFKALEAKLKQSEDRISTLQKALEDELSKPAPQPKVIEVPKVPPEMIKRLMEQEQLLKEKEDELSKLKERKELTTDYSRQIAELNNEIAKLANEQRKLKESVDEEQFRLNQASEFMAKFQKAAKPLKEVKGELESLGQSAVFHWSQARRLQDNIDTLQEVLDMVSNMLKTVNVSNLVGEEVYDAEFSEL